MNSSIILFNALFDTHNPLNKPPIGNDAYIIMVGTGCVIVTGTPAAKRNSRANINRSARKMILMETHSRVIFNFDSIDPMVSLGLD